MHVARKVEILEISERLQKKKRRKRMLTVCNNMDDPNGIMLSKISQTNAI